MSTQPSMPHGKTNSATSLSVTKPTKPANPKKVPTTGPTTPQFQFGCTDQRAEDLVTLCVNQVRTATASRQLITYHDALYAVLRLVAAHRAALDTIKDLFEAEARKLGIQEDEIYESFQSALLIAQDNPVWALQPSVLENRLDINVTSSQSQAGSEVPVIHAGLRVPLLDLQTVFGYAGEGVWGMARLLLRLLGKGVRYDQAIKAFYLWTGHAYQQDWANLIKDTIMSTVQSSR